MPPLWGAPFDRGRQGKKKDLYARLWRAGVVGGPLTLQGATACTMNLARKAAKKGAQILTADLNTPVPLAPSFQHLFSTWNLYRIAGPPSPSPQVSFIDIDSLLTALCFPYFLFFISPVFRAIDS